MFALYTLLLTCSLARAHMAWDNKVSIIPFRSGTTYIEVDEPERATISAPSVSMIPFRSGTTFITVDSPTRTINTKPPVISIMPIKTETFDHSLDLSELATRSTFDVSMLPYHPRKSICKSQDSPFSSSSSTCPPRNSFPPRRTFSFRKNIPICAVTKSVPHYSEISQDAQPRKASLDVTIVPTCSGTTCISVDYPTHTPLLFSERDDDPESYCETVSIDPVSLESASIEAFTTNFQPTSSLAAYLTQLEARSEEDIPIRPKLSTLQFSMVSIRTGTTFITIDYPTRVKMSTLDVTIKPMRSHTTFITVDSPTRITNSEYILSVLPISESSHVVIVPPSKAPRLEEEEE
ncbi:hypothetical protein TBLA_0D05170 [Henningerozyma blattae CBS 6284]|uniref:Uncharacterized protein n=1 Tax=Henningerozyma blattae (strain ATCC 34711 / CBS 6284 / DSM 70876 / NBRC 10599 / NRRL Y-10934 / UCD 77-7) TaxID=1071380 RepID=I2H3Q8_HENB6|nr:hypothetical protein TBLA_0D05170 [Tetrapisispora blattae CBS 6284]CCH61010.1 hypothetical protein TBLA_0D05170 [Tetrapisispora blattae CBS 6284]